MSSLFVYEMEQRRIKFTLRDARIRWSIAKQRMASQYLDVGRNVAEEYYAAKQSLFDAREDMRYASTALERKLKRETEQRIAEARPKINLMRQVLTNEYRDAMRVAEREQHHVAELLIRLTDQVLATKRQLSRVQGDSDEHYLEKYEEGRVMIFTSIEMPDVLLEIIVQYTFA